MYVAITVMLLHNSQNAAVAIGRLANHSEDLANSVISNDIIPQLVSNLSSENKYYKKAAASALRGVARHTATHAEYIITSKGMSGIIACMESPDNSVRESAVSALGFIVRHTEEYAKAAVDAGVLAIILNCMKSGDMSVKRSAALCLSEIAKHSESLASSIVDLGFVPLLVQEIDTPSDIGLRKNALSCLGNMCKHSPDIGASVMRAGLFPRIVPLLRDPHEHVRKNACILLRDISKHSLELSREIMGAGGVGGLLEYLKMSSGVSKVSAIVCFGYMASFSETLAKGLIVSEVLPVLTVDLLGSSDDCVLSAVAWTIGQIGRHSSEHSRSVTDQSGCMKRLVELYMDQSNSEDLKAKAKASFKVIVSQCTIMSVLEPLLAGSPLKIQKALLRQFSKVLPADIPARKSFVHSGCLKLMQEIQAEPGTKIRQFIADINALFPPEIVNFYSPQYPEVLMKKLEEYSGKPAKQTKKPQPSP
jgi:3-methyladenine DNA glycosylase AlkD